MHNDDYDYFVNEWIFKFQFESALPTNGFVWVRIVNGCKISEVKHDRIENEREREKEHQNYVQV